jgi:hypothetical protein
MDTRMWQHGPMTDTSPWAAPGGPSQPSAPATPFSPSAPPPVNAPPPVGAPLSPPPLGAPLPPPPVGAPLPPPAGQPVAGWTPPPKPGLIPLRPLTLGTLLGASFQVMRRNPRPTFGFALLLAGAVSVVSVIAMGLVGFILFSRPLQGSSEDQFTLMAGSVMGGFVLGFFVPLALGLVAFSILQGIIALEVARGTVGEKLRLGGLWRAARGRIAVLVGWSVLLVGVAVLFFAVVGLVVGALTVGFGTDAIGASIAVFALAYLAFIVLGAWLGTKTALVPSILIIERLTLGKAIARSWQLTRDAFWRTFGTILLVSVIVGTATSIITTPVQFLFGIVAGLLTPTGGTADDAVVLVVVFAAVITVVTVIVTAIGLIVQSSATALIYIDLRMRKEGLDLELARFVEARQAGDTSVPDPYVRTPSTSVPTMPGAASSSGTSPWS